MSQIRQNALRALLPPPKLPLADWIENSVHLPGTVSALPGRMRLWSYQRGICEAIDDPDVERISVIKSARIGYTSLLTATLGHFAANAPAPIMVVLPTQDDSRDYSVGDVELTFEASPTLRGLLNEESDEAGRSTILSRRFPGGSLKFVAAKTPRNLRRHTVKILLLDEVDAYEVTGEGNPVDLAEMRTLTFPDRKIIAGSTPVFDHGPISRLYAESDQRIFEVPCPECGEHHEIKWRDIRWPDGKPEQAQWCCPGCGSFIDEKHKAEMVSGGRWRATRPEIKGHAGFKINALVSPHANASWGKLAAEFLQAKGDPVSLQAFSNLVLGEPWQTEGDELDESDLAARREALGLDAIPSDVLLITAGVDCQDDRFECVLLGHGKSESFVLAHRVIWGPIEDDLVWRELDDLLRSTWPHPGGAHIGVSGAVVDSGDGGHSDVVHAFTRSRFARRIVSGKGVSGFSRPAIQRSSTKGAPLFLIGVDGIKSQLFARLSRGTGMRFSADLEAVFFEQLASERAVVRYSRGQPVRRFERIPGKRAETLDATVYAIAARGLVNLNLERREAELSSQAAAPAPIASVKSAWLNR